MNDQDDSLNSNEPLFWTSYIESNRIEDLRKAACVKPFLDNIKSYAGFITVNKELNSNMFVWFFPAELNNNKAPLVVWLNGWCTSSLYGLFIQNGPFIYGGTSLSRRKTSWQKWYNVLYIDNPIGIGFSHTASEAGYSQDTDSISTNLYWTLCQFLQVFTEYQLNEVYLAGLSFCGKFITTFANQIDLGNSLRSEKINLKGLFIGNPLMDPEQLHYADYLYQLGFIDYNEKLVFLENEQKAHELFEKGEFSEGYDILRDLILDDRQSYFKDSSGLNSIYDYSNDSTVVEHWKTFVQLKHVRNCLHIGDVELGDGSAFRKYFKRDQRIVSSKPLLGKLLDKYRVLIYTGQCDIVCSYPKISEVLKDLVWSGSDKFCEIVRQKLYDGKKLCGYIKSFSNLTEVMILEAGHSVVSDKPEYTLDLLNYFIGYLPCEFLSVDSKKLHEM